jgi:hypothetical protein
MKASLNKWIKKQNGDTEKSISSNLIPFDERHCIVRNYDAVVSL